MKKATIAFWSKNLCDHEVACLPSIFNYHNSNLFNFFNFINFKILRRIFSFILSSETPFIYTLLTNKTAVKCASAKNNVISMWSQEYLEPWQPR